MYVAFELSNKNWKLGISDGSKTRIIDVTAADLAGVQEAIKKARERFRLPDQTPAYSCYEAGRDGFWLHRWLTQQGINNRVVDSSSIEVNRRARRAKTDRLDVQKLLTMLMRAVGGERGVWKEVKVPTVAQEDDRRPQRELLALQEDEGRTVSQMRSVLKLFGIDDRRLKRRLKALDELRQHDGQPLPFNAKEQLRRMVEHRKVIASQIKEIESRRREQLEAAVKSLHEKPDPATVTPEHLRRHVVGQKVFRLMSLCGIGVQSSWLCVTEFFAWREFKNRRQVAGAAGLAPVPYDSGDSHQNQGLSRAGNGRIRSMMVLIAWGWLNYQPDSDVSQWYRKKFETGKVSRKKGIVALARRLLIALWRYLEFGEVPAGARLKEHVSLS
jgi:transposase